MDGWGNRSAMLAVLVLIAGSAGCVSVAPDRLASLSRLDGGAIPSPSALEAMISVEVVEMAPPEAETALAAGTPGP